MRRSSILLAMPFAVLASGCTVGPDFTGAKAPKEASLTPQGTEKIGVIGQQFRLGEKLKGDWWTLYRSDPLNATVRQAIDGSPTLVSAAATLYAADEAVNQTRGGLYPQVDAGVGALRQHTNGAALGLAKLPPGFPPYSNVFHPSVSVGYTIDVWGGIRRAIEQSQALADVQDYELDAAYLTLTGSAVSQALTIASLRAQIAAVETIIADDETTLRLVNTEVQAGAATQLDVETATSQLATDRTLAPPLRQQLDVARHALAVLAGKTPGDWTPPVFDLDQITLPTEIPVSVASELVHQRPDILAAEANVHAASAGIGVATAQLYPNFTLNGSVAQEAVTVDTLFHGANNIWSIAANVTTPLFHGGTLEAQKRRAVDLYDASLANYEQTVLSSFGQVADVLQALAHDGELLSEEEQAVSAAQASLDLTRRSYSLGNIGVLQVVDAQRQLEQARLGFVRARAQRYIDTASLMVAMGGGWWDWRQQSAQAVPVPAAAPAR